MESEKTIVGICPICGGNVVKTFNAFTCENMLSENPTCKFTMFGVVGNRRISDEEARLLFERKNLLLDGFSTKEGKIFTSVISFNEDGTTALNSQVGTCPKCGGTLYASMRGVSCSNYKEPTSCKFNMWRNIAGHTLSFEDIQQLLSGEQVAIRAYDAKGNVSDRKIALDPTHIVQIL